MTRIVDSRKNRRDHYLPQSYLRGFIDPERLNHQQPLWHFDVINSGWSERSPREVGYRLGFYDYVADEVGGETADKAFAHLESSYPRVRGDLISTKFQNWKDHRDFLLRYIQMMRARSLLFVDQKNIEGKNRRAWTIEKIHPDRKTVKVRSMIPEPLSAQSIRNWTITQMREEIRKGAAWLNDFNWCLRYCKSPRDPFVISEVPVMACGPASNLEALRNPETLLFFPLCWQACLIGSRQSFDEDTGVFLEEDMRSARNLYRQEAELFILSPSQIDF